MRKYETVILARQDISPTQVDGLVAHFSQILTTGGGRVINHEYCGLKSLAYRIRKNRKGHFVLLDIESTPDAMKEMERLMRINEDVLRFLTVKVDQFGPRPSPLAQSRYGREDHRSFRDDAVETESVVTEELVSASASIE